MRGFGLISPISQPPGAAYQMAMASREIWMEFLQSARLPYQPTGSLHLAYHQDEFDVIREFADLGPSFGYVCQRLDPKGPRRDRAGWERYDAGVRTGAAGLGGDGDLGLIYFLSTVPEISGNVPSVPVLVCPRISP